MKDQLSAEVDVDGEGRNVNEESETKGFMQTQETRGESAYHSAAQQMLGMARFV